MSISSIVLTVPEKSFNWKMGSAFLLCVFLTFSVCAQKKVAISIDDIPNTKKYQKDDFKSGLLQKLDSIQIPISIFVIEGLIYKTDSISKNFSLLMEWTDRPYITLGNHSFNHSRSSELTVEQLEEEVLKGEAISRELAKHFGKELKYFRFPFNDLGKDSIQQKAFRDQLESMGYEIMPFTVESADWMFNSVYEHFLEKGDHQMAVSIGEEYVSKTLALFEFFETLSLEEYNRLIPQIYLCHDNSINEAYLPKIIEELGKRGYDFVGVEEALADPAYHQTNYYDKKWGVSWFYRWMKDQEEAMIWMRKEPSLEGIQKQFDAIQN
ncbi:polysaccharide deacetylase family protein [Algoriphagus pacificus]|uniref:Polysaccharide deacetylase family protein n=1 Tax=Algoriphagus pacificus TaxID=2811234 RepID=A0ABS3CJJ8_9BACT|nr:polysaccharide deacetylase family protein [Algoriphagus pacificus]MBN7816331.1 polysaccharide deacetylase family protein [Algoriphagus pacificus]